ncbi:hypothetical protein [Kineothrix sedimenti]|uniref:Uncharacterized protein n=1 Tax=Kineothrix sedimenti TaxID=3123317 RepID=A0ABZ3F053_9FIRM
MGILGVNNKVLSIIEKTRNALETGEMAAENFPMEEVSSLLENTLGQSFWSCITSEKKDGYEKIPAVYMKLFRYLVGQKDLQGCAGLLEVFEMQYRSIYDALGKYEVYQETIREMGDAWSRQQYTLHEERQGHWEGHEEPLPGVRGVVYTCLFNKERQVKEPVYKNAFWDYICFTDQEDKWGKMEGVWQFRKAVNPQNWKPGSLTIYYMINAHKLFPDYDFSIWISPEMHIVGELEQWYEVYGKNSSFLAFPDYKNDNVYDLIFTTMNNDDMNIAGRQKFYNYRKEGYPEHYGMIDTRCIFRNHRDELLCQVLDDWWEGTAKDLIYGKYCFNYAAWKRNFRFALCNQFIEKNYYITNTELELGKE